MCGIVGYVGLREAVPLLLQGLRRLEYRGYDSAGVAVLNGSGIAVVKQSGKLSALEQQLQQHPHGNAGHRPHPLGDPRSAHHHERPTGYLAEIDAVQARLEHLEDVLISLAHIASVDAFQHWIYASGSGADAASRDAAWLRIRSRFDPEVDWTGLGAGRVARWYRQLHIFLYPFYYIEYGIAQLGALQVWRNSLADPEGAVTAYRRFLELGATRALPDLYAAAGAALVFDAGRMADLVAAVGAECARLRAGMPATPLGSGMMKLPILRSVPR